MTLGSGQFGPRCMVGRNYIGDHYALLHTEHYKLCTSWFQGSLSHFYNMGAFDPEASLDRRGMVGRISVGDH